MSGTGRFEAELQAVKGRPLSCTCFRLVGLEAYHSVPTPRLLFDGGPKSVGQRFSPPGDHLGLYVSPEHLTACYEYAGGRQNWEVGEVSHTVMFKIVVKLANVLDLTIAANRRMLQTSAEELNSGWQGYAKFNSGAWPPTWELGHAAFASTRFDGIYSLQIRIRLGLAS